MRLNNQFSWKTATFMARLSKHAYTGLKDFKKHLSKLIGKILKCLNMAVLNVIYLLVQKTIS